MTDIGTWTAITLLGFFGFIAYAITIPSIRRSRTLHYEIRLKKIEAKAETDALFYRTRLEETKLNAPKMIEARISRE